MKRNVTELVFLLDRSGSMQGLEADTIGGFNAMLEKQKKEPGVVLVTTVLFDHETEMLHDRADLRRVAPLTAKEYTVRGTTALLDALGSTIRHIGMVHRYARKEDVPEHTIFVVTTDGMENASRRWSLSQVRRMIEEKQRKCGWEFLFLGANIDAVETAGSLGIRPERAANFACDSEGLRLQFEAIGSAFSCARRGEAINDGWKDKLEADLAARRD